MIHGHEDTLIPRHHGAGTATRPPWQGAPGEGAEWFEVMGAGAQNDVFMNGGEGLARAGWAAFVSRGGPTRVSRNPLTLSASAH